ncbi:MAG: helix-turn-helix domain-containing protein [Candidatus Aminicenantes bacterium]|nr:helix-turn-helix domain-containing protein [Candidatus Aminicenantes bacterium]
MDPRINKAVEFINSNIYKNLKMQEISHISYLSYRYFSKLFKKEMGICFSKYIIKIRIKEAKSLLKNDLLSIKEISYKVGYKHVSNFNHEFRRQTGLSPTKYRNYLKKM